MDLFLRRVQFDHGEELLPDLLYRHGVRGESHRHAQLLGLPGLGERQVLLQLTPLAAAHLELLQGGADHGLEGLEDTLVHGLLQDCVWREGSDERSWHAAEKSQTTSG